MKALDPRKSSYPSEVPILLIVECANLLSTPLTALFNQCFIYGVFPGIFKQACVTLIPDMRPNSKTPALSKVFESFIFDYFFDDIKDNMDSQQFVLLMFIIWLVCGIPCLNI